MPSSRGSGSFVFRLSTLACALALCLAPGRALHAGSTKPNYPALKQRADQTRNDLHAADGQWTWLSGKHAGKEWGAKYDGFALKHDVAGLNQFLKISGFEFNPFSTTDKLCSGKVCLGLPAMDDWERRNGEHKPLVQRLDSFFLKLSQDKGFGEKFEQLVMHNNRQGLIDFCRSAGLGDIQILTVDTDFKFHFKCGFFEIHLEW